MGGLLFHGLRVRVLDDALEDPRSTSELLKVTDESANGAYRLRHHFRSWAGPFDLMAELRVESKALRCRVWLENEPAAKPWFKVYLQQVALGAWNEKARRVYGGVGNVLEDPQPFTMSFDGHNLASSYVGFEFPAGSIVEAVDTPPDRLSVDPSRSIYALDVPLTQTITLIPAANVWEGVKIWRDLDTRKASAGVPQLAGRFVFDIWGGRYGESAQLLKKAFQYGLTNSAVVWHNWQRWGYDYRLPDVYPPNPSTARSTNSGNWSMSASRTACSSHRTTTTSICIPTPKASATRASSSPPKANRRRHGFTTRAWRRATARGPINCVRWWSAT